MGGGLCSPKPERLWDLEGCLEAEQPIRHVARGVNIGIPNCGLRFSLDGTLNQPQKGHPPTNTRHLCPLSTGASQVLGLKETISSEAFLEDMAKASWNPNMAGCRGILQKQSQVEAKLR